MIDRKFFAPHEFKLDDAGNVQVAFAQLDVVDKDGDLTLPGAFPAKDVALGAYGHMTWDGALPTGRGSIREEGGWALLDGKFFTDTTAGRDTYLTVKGMAGLQEWSYGYKVLDAGFETRDGQPIRILKSLDVFEVSPVLVGAGVGTHTRAIKGAGSALPYAEQLAWVSDELKALIDRSHDRADWRSKEGRVMSAANMDRLMAIRDQVTSMVADLESMIADMAPPKEADFAALRVLRDRLLVETARANGVPVTN